MLWEPLLTRTGQEESQQQLQDSQAMLETPGPIITQGHMYGVLSLLLTVGHLRL